MTEVWNIFLKIIIKFAWRLLINKSYTIYPWTQTIKDKNKYLAKSVIAMICSPKKPPIVTAQTVLQLSASKKRMGKDRLVLDAWKLEA